MQTRTLLQLLASTLTRQDPRPRRSGAAVYGRVMQDTGRRQICSTCGGYRGLYTVYRVARSGLRVEYTPDQVLSASWMRASCEVLSRCYRARFGQDGAYRELRGTS